VADKFGRRIVFTCALLWYCVASLIMAFQTDATGLYFWRFVAGVGIGVELVTIDTFISELVPKAIRGRAFAIYQAIQFSVVPIVAFLSYKLVPLDPYGFSGWRWVVAIGSVGAVAVWVIRIGIPESPRWLAAHGRLAEADRIVSALEAQVAIQYCAPLPPIGPADAVIPRGSALEIFRAPYLSRTVMLVIFNAFQAVGF
jgi:putative MFS transporter